MDIKDIGYPIPGLWYHGIDRIFYIHQEGCEEPPEYSQPHQFELEQNYLNPFNSTTAISYQLPALRGQRSAVSLKIYNILGEEVKTLVNRKQKGGYYSVTWEGDDEGGREVGSGIYFYRLEVEGLKAEMVRKMVLIR